MNRLLHVLILALFLGPQFGVSLMAPAPECDEAQDCCPSDGDCSATCAVCACCGLRVSNLAEGTATELRDAPRAWTLAAANLTPLAPPPAEILHVPKSSSN